jgi:elongation factor P hydroxylase
MNFTSASARRDSHVLRTEHRSVRDAAVTLPIDCDSVCALFDELYAGSENTRLQKGGDEPLYLPVDDSCSFDRIIFRHDYVASALHEVAHWCIAGVQRRRLRDYGYWYHPDGRDGARQRAFEQVEARPQALEWLFSDVCSLRFRPSIDNLASGSDHVERFAAAIVTAARAYCIRGLPPRAQRFRAALASHCGHDSRLSAADFSIARLLA